MLLEKIGLIGWERIEPIIFSAIVAKRAVLLVGNPGTSKTEGAARISRAVQGKNMNFKSYDVPALNHEDLLGVFNPSKLADGELDFVKTPLSIWGATSILLDEINCTNISTQSKLHELIRTQEIMGIDTGIELVFGAINPPDKFQTAYMSVPLASRFVTLEVPSISEMNEAQLDKILDADFKSKPTFYGKKIAECRELELPKTDIEKIRRVCRQLIKLLSKDNNLLSFEGRSFQFIYSMLIAYFSCKKVFKNLYTQEDTVTDIIMSVIPEVNRAVRSTSDVDALTLRNQITNLVVDIMVSEDMKNVETLEDLLELEIVDELNWLNSAKQFIEEESSLKKLSKVRDNAYETDYPDHIKNQVAKFVTDRSVFIKIQKGGVLSTESMKRGLK